MKIIDLLNKIANGEEVPKLIKWDGTTWYFNEDLKNYSIVQDYEEYEHLLDYQITKYLNDEIEIIEEPKKIENLRYSCKIDKTKDSYENVESALVSLHEVALKVQEIIDYINKGDSNE